jgi:peptidyl-prolyl cis-trans isomerase SurA
MTVIMHIISKNNLISSSSQVSQKISLLIFLMIPVLIMIPAHTHSAVLLDRVVATVNDEVITWSELMSAIMLEGRALLDKAAAEERKKQIKELERPYLEELINLRLQLQAARKMRLSVGEAEIDASIAEIRSKYNLTDESLKASLEAEGLTMNEYRSRLREQILLQKTVNFAVQSKIVITDNSIEKHYRQNKETYAEKESLKIRQIFFRDPEDASARSALLTRAEVIARDIRDGKDFSELAREFSEGPEKEFGGDLGYLKLGSALKEVEDAALALKIGEVSRPFWSPAGLHIIKLEDRRGDGGIDTVRDRIREKLFQEVFQSKYRHWRAGLREKAYIEIKL